MSAVAADWIPDDVDRLKASPSRVYDYLLGGGCNFSVDREWAEQAIRRMPWIRAAARSNRTFLRRAVAFCAGAGVRQFLDLGSGIPTAQSVHEIARRIDPESRVVYVDNERVAVSHSELLLADIKGTGIIEADLCDVDYVLEHDTTRSLLDFDQPVALIITAALYYVADPDLAVNTVKRYLAALAPGSYLVLSHATLGRHEQDAMKLSHVLEMTKSLTTSATARSPEWILGLFDGLDIVEPGLVYTSNWRPEGPQSVDESPWQAAVLAAVGRKTP
ncbi:MAG: SAM-dependent methyltransferase [Kutzneria sp.]|nr:SAM-dependent methyltransferase [Kutzneria sp.]